jgi:pyrimidine-nucleoside phosphorylase
VNPVEIITAKRNGEKLSPDEIRYFIDGFTAGEIPDYQMAVFLMAIYFRSMTTVETTALTSAMLESGKKIVFDPESKLYVDKHSSGGLGDKVSIILAPLMAACGLKVPMLSGRGLGHTGGTLDKLESIPGFRTDLSIKEFKAGVKSIGCIISGQTPEIAPADRKMYALRDVTGTVESVPLICSSILSKKFASGPNSIVFDIKCGNGAFMKDQKQAEHLGKDLTGICKAMGKGSAFLVTDMNQPLGRTVGNALEIDEAVAALQGNAPADLLEVVLGLGECMLTLGEVAFEEKAFNLQKSKIDDGSAFEKFLEMVAFQGGDTKSLTKKKPLAPAKKIFPIKSEMAGFINAIDTFRLGKLIIEMGGGRTKLGQKIDHSVGLVMHKKLGDEVASGDVIMDIHSSGKQPDDYLVDAFAGCIQFGGEIISAPEIIKKWFK